MMSRTDEKQVTLAQRRLDSHLFWKDQTVAPWLNP